MKRHKNNLYRAAMLAVLTGVLAANPMNTAQAATPNPAGCVDDGNIWYNTNSLYTQNVNTGSNTTVGSIGATIGDIAWGADGNLYGVVFNNSTSTSSTTPTLRVINPTTGATTTTKTINMPNSAIDFNGLGGLPNGNLLMTTGSGAQLSGATAATSRIYTFDPAAASPTATIWIELKDPNGNYVLSTGDMVYYDGSVYSLMYSPSAKQTYLFRIPVNNDFSPISSSGYTSVVVKKPDGTSLDTTSEVLYGMALYKDTFYAAMAGDNNTYTLNSNTGQLTDSTRNYAVSGPYGMTARPEPFGGTCPGALTVTKSLPKNRLSDTDQFTVQILKGSTVVNNTTNSTTTGSGSTVTTGKGTTGAYPALITTNSTPTYTINEVMATGSTSTLSNYTTTVSCVNNSTAAGKTDVSGVTKLGDSITPKSGDNIQCTISNSAIVAPLDCQNKMYQTYGTTSTSFTEIRPVDINGVVSNSILTTSSSTALGVSSDGRYLTYTTGPTSLVVYDVVSGTSKTTTFTNTSNQSILKMAIAENGTGYFMSRGYLWSFTIDASGTAVVGSEKALTYTDNSGSSPAAQVIGNGDLFVSKSGDLFVVTSPSDPASGNAIAANYVDIFRVATSGAATFYGRVQVSTSNVTVNAVAALNGKIYISTLDRSMYELDLTTLTVVQKQTAQTTFASDLASCSYPALAPTITSTKSVAKVDPSTGAVLTTPVQAGDTFEYTIVTRNSGTLNAANATLQDTVPTGTTYVAGSTTMNFGAVTDATGTGNARMPFNTARIISSPGAAGGVVEVDSTASTTTTSTTDADDNEVVVKFRVTVNSGVTEIRNKATVVHADGTVPTNETVTSTGAPNLTIVKSVDTSYVKVTPDAAGGIASVTPQDVIYTITINNTGTVAATGVNLNDTLPTGMTYQGVEAGTPTPTAVSGQTLTWNGLNVAVSTPQTFKVRVRPTITANTNTTNAPYQNTAQLVNGSTTTPSNTVKTDVAYTRLFKQVHNLGKSATATSPTVPASSPAWSSASTGLPGDVLEYCIDFYNYGSAALSSYLVSDVVPTNTTFLPGSIFVKSGTMSTTPITAFSGATSAYDSATNTVKATIGTLAAGATGSMCFRATIK